MLCFLQIALAVAVVIAGLHRKLRQLLAEERVVDRRREHDGNDRLVAVVEQHFRSRQAPFRRDHQHRGRGEIRQHPADRDIDEQKTQRAIREQRRRLQLVELLRQQHRGNGHRAGLGDEGPEQRPDDQDGKPPGGGRFLAEVRKETQAAFRKPQHGSGGGQRHDDHHEQRLGEIHVVHQVALDRFKVVVGEHRAEQHHDPDPEDGFHFAEEVQQGRLEADHVPVAGGGMAFADLCVVIVLDLVRQLGDRDRDKGMEDREDKNHRRDQQERLLFRTESELGSDALDPRRGFPVTEVRHLFHEFRGLQPVVVRRLQGSGHHQQKQQPEDQQEAPHVGASFAAEHVTARETGRIASGGGSL